MRASAIGVFAPLFFILACTGANLPSIAPPVVYELDLSGSLDGAAWEGIAVGSADSKHDIRIESKTDVNYMTIQSCHRFEKYEDVIIDHWYRPKRGFEYSYTESPGIEDTGYCVLRLSAFSKQVGAGEAYGLMLFHSPGFTLPGENICNGADGATAGTSICQSMTGLVQRLRFKEQVVTATKNSDGTSLKGQCSGAFIDATTFQYTMPVGECVAVFMSTAKPHRYYIHLAYGFTKTQYRGSQ